MVRFRFPADWSTACVSQRVGVVVQRRKCSLTPYPSSVTVLGPRSEAHGLSQSQLLP
jgi:hypothetical protein